MHSTGAEVIDGIELIDIESLGYRKDKVIILIIPTALDFARRFHRHKVYQIEVSSTVVANYQFIFYAFATVSSRSNTTSPTFLLSMERVQ